MTLSNKLGFFCETFDNYKFVFVVIVCCFCFFLQFVQFELNYFEEKLMVHDSEILILFFFLSFILSSSMSFFFMSFILFNHHLYNYFFVYHLTMYLAFFIVLSSVSFFILAFEKTIIVLQLDYKNSVSLSALSSFVLVSW